MATDECLSESDVSKMMDVLGHIAGLDEDLATKRRILLEKLAELIDTDCWHCCLLDSKTPGESLASSDF